VPTLPVLYLRRRAEMDADSAELLERLERAIDASTDDELDPDFAPAVAALRRHPVTDDTLAEARRWADQAVEALEPLPDGPVKKALTRFAQAIVERSG
jgi:heptaprenyl diphosphate synthase